MVIAILSCTPQQDTNLFHVSTTTDSRFQLTTPMPDVLPSTNPKCSPALFRSKSHTNQIMHDFSQKFDFLFRHFPESLLEKIITFIFYNTSHFESRSLTLGVHTKYQPLLDLLLTFLCV